MNSRLNWPENFNELEIHNLSITEVWVLQELYKSGSINSNNHKSTKFGYDECNIDLEGDRYLIKYHNTDWMDYEMKNRKNRALTIFYIRKV